MIRFTSVRSDMPEWPRTNEHTPLSALICLVKYELGYGGWVTQASVTGDSATLTTRTPVFTHYDVDTFTGPIAEMSLLLQAIQVHTALYNRDGEAMMTAAMEAVARHDTRTLVLTSLPRILAGEGLIRSVYLGLIGQQCEPHLPALKARSNDDLAALAVLVHEGHSFEECLAL